MKDPIEQLFANLETVKLEPEEKSLLRQKLIAEIGGRKTFAWAYRWAAPVLILVMAIGGTVSLAAEHALPGEKLYPIKTKINEPVARLLMPAQKAGDWKENLLDKRLVEAEEVAKQGKLTEPLKSQIKDNIAKHAEEVKNDDKEGGKNKKEKKVLEKHGEILRKLNLVDKESKDQNKEEIERIDKPSRHK